MGVWAAAFFKFPAPLLLDPDLLLDLDPLLHDLLPDLLLDLDLLRKEVLKDLLLDLDLPLQLQYFLTCPCSLIYPCPN